MKSPRRKVEPSIAWVMELIDRLYEHAPTVRGERSTQKFWDFFCKSNMVEFRIFSVFFPFPHRRLQQLILLSRLLRSTVKTVCFKLNEPKSRIILYLHKQQTPPDSHGHWTPSSMKSMFTHSLVGQMLVFQKRNVGSNCVYSSNRRMPNRSMLCPVFFRRSNQDDLITKLVINSLAQGVKKLSNREIWNKFVRTKMRLKERTKIES